MGTGREPQSNIPALDRLAHFIFTRRTTSSIVAAHFKPYEGKKRRKGRVGMKGTSQTKEQRAIRVAHGSEFCPQRFGEVTPVECSLATLCNVHVRVRNLWKRI